MLKGGSGLNAGPDHPAEKQDPSPSNAMVYPLWRIPSCMR